MGAASCANNNNGFDVISEALEHLNAHPRCLARAPDVPAERIESLLLSAFTAPLFYPRDDRTRRWRASVLCGMAKLFICRVGVRSGARGCKAGCSELSDASTF